MDNKFKLKVNQSIDFEFSKKQVKAIDLIQEKNSKYHVLHNDQAFMAELLHSDFNQKKYTISVNSNTYEIEIENPLDLLIKKLGFSVGSVKQINDIKAPMPGIIIDVNVKEGDQVVSGDPLVILEAMKMENAICSPKDAIVKSVFVKTGNTVEKNKLLIELE